MIISLTGFMGCGKSSVGRELSQLLCCPFVDLDTAIEEKAGMSVPDIFAQMGETGFRKLEKETLAEIIEQHDSHEQSWIKTPALVIALGGGAVMTDENYQIIRDKTTNIYLQASIETLVDRLSGNTSNRPLLQDNSQESQEKQKALLRDKINDLFARRESTYERISHIKVATDCKTISEVSQIICSALSE